MCAGCAVCCGLTAAALMRQVTTRSNPSDRRFKQVGACTLKMTATHCACTLLSTTFREHDRCPPRRKVWDAECKPRALRPRGASWTYGRSTRTPAQHASFGTNLGHPDCRSCLLAVNSSGAALSAPLPLLVVGQLCELPAVLRLPWKSSRPHAHLQDRRAPLRTGV